MKKLIYITLVFSVIVLSSAVRSFACTCLVTNEPLETQIQKAFHNSSIVFSGEVTTVEPKDEYRLLVRIKTAQLWKGEVEKEYQINTASQSSLCGYHFEVGKKYLVYANQGSDGLMTTNCSRTAIFNRQDDVQYLGKLVQIFDDSTPKIRLKNGVKVNSTIGGEAHDSYVIHVKKGQTLKIQTSWKSNRGRNVNFFVSESDNFFESEKAKRGTETKDGKNWWMKMRKTGDYYIYVTAYPTVDYTIKATVK